MSNDDDVISRGRFKGKNITFASTDLIDEFNQIACEFMGNIFDFLPGEYLITDESDISDFTEFGSSDTSEIWKKIMDVYGFDESEIGSGRFAKIFAEIARRRNIQ
jgi:hypothetical protein